MVRVRVEKEGAESALAFPGSVVMVMTEFAQEELTAEFLSAAHVSALSPRSAPLS